MEMNLVYSIVWKFWENNKDLEYEDMLSVAFVAYCEALKNYDSKRNTKKTTLACVYMKRAISDWIRKEREQRNLFVPLVDEEENEYEIPVPFVPPISELLEEMGQEAKVICKMILETPLEFAGLPPKICKGKIYKKLRSEGWSWKKIWDSFKEIKGVLNET